MPLHVDGPTILNDALFVHSGLGRFFEQLEQQHIVWSALLTHELPIVELIDDTSNATLRILARLLLL